MAGAARQALLELGARLRRARLRVARRLVLLERLPVVGDQLTGLLPLDILAHVLDAHLAAVLEVRDRLP